MLSFQKLMEYFYALTKVAVWTLWYNISSWNQN